MSDFKPAIDNPFILNFTKLILPYYLRFLNLELKPTQHCLDTFSRLRGKPTVVLVNHSDRYDPVTVFGLSTLCGEDFYYLAARELFDGMFGLNGYGLQCCGAFSVIRGGGDRTSAEKTISYITEARRKVITFPEGDVSGRDDLISPLKEDGIRNLFEAQRRLLRNGRKSALYLLPTAIFYEVPPESYPILSARLGDMEHALSLPYKSATIEDRTFRLVGALVDHLEHTYRIESRAQDSYSARLTAVARQATNALVEYLNLDVPPSDNENVTLYNARGEIRRLSSRASDYCDCEYSQRVLEVLKGKAEFCTKEMSHIQQWLILSSSIQQPSFTPEMAWRLIDRLELEILGKSRSKGHRVVRIETAQPIDMMKLWPNFRRDAHEAVYYTDQLIRMFMNEALQSLRPKQPAKPYTPIAA